MDIQGADGFAVGNAVAHAAATFPFDAVIFDMDGVLVDTEARYAQDLLDYTQEFGLPVLREEIFGMVGTSQKVFDAKICEWWGRAGRNYTAEQALDHMHRWDVRHPVDYAQLLNPGVAETLQALKDAGVRIALASSSPLSNIREVLEACGIAGHFESITSGEQFHESKPEPEIYLHTLGLLGLPASACCCVEDSVPGITAGKRAGLFVFAKREERFGFSQDAADCIIDGIPDLLEMR